jgi:hypothetical protein
MNYDVIMLKSIQNMEFNVAFKQILNHLKMIKLINNLHF